MYSLNLFSTSIIIVTYELFYLFTLCIYYLKFKWLFRINLKNLYIIVVFEINPIILVPNSKYSLRYYYSNAL